MAKRIDFDKIIRNYKLGERKAAKFIATEAIEHFKSSFENQGFTDSSKSRWPEVGRRTPGSPSYGKGFGKGFSAAATKRAILVGTGNLQDSIMRKGSSFRRIRIIANEPYARIHNRGLKGNAFGKHTFKMPKRQFMGSSRVLSKTVLNLMQQHVKRSFN